MIDWLKKSKTYFFGEFPMEWAVAGGGGKSSNGAVTDGENSSGLGGDLSNSAIGATSGIGDTMFVSIFSISRYQIL